MSLILDALRKLEREKSAREPGVLVVGSVPWGETSRMRRLVLAAGAALVLAFAVLLGWLLRPVPKPAAAGAPGAAISPTPGPSPSAPATLPLPTQPPALAQQPTPLPSAPPIRLSRPVPSVVGTAPRPTVASPDAASGARAPEPAIEAPSEVPTEPAGRLSVAPAAAGAGEAAPVAPPGELRLTAISQRDGRPVALINDRLVFEGDSFEGVRVLRIGETEVEVEVRGERRVLRF
jgi:type IV secretory pathway VirB10-like protein